MCPLHFHEIIMTLLSLLFSGRAEHCRVCSVAWRGSKVMENQGALNLSLSACLCRGHRVLCGRCAIPVDKMGHSCPNVTSPKVA